MVGHLAIVVHKDERLEKIVHTNKLVDVVIW
jgi:hypothetical protein